jgi:heterodisulfide reductase subunit B
MDTNKVLREAVINMMETEPLEIKPCPFCGGTPTLMDQKTFEHLKEIGDDGKACITIECHKCQLSFYDHTHDEQDYFIRKFLVTEKWNRRAE